MNPSRGLLAAVACVAGLLALPSTASAEPDRVRGKGARICAKLECSADQKTQLREIFSEMREDARAERKAIRTLHGQMRAEFTKNSPDEAKLRKLQAEIETHRSKLATRRLDAMLDVHAILDADQREMFLDMMQRRRGKHRAHRRGRRGGERHDSSSD